MAKYIKNWRELAQVPPNDKYKIVLEEGGYSGWIKPVKETEETYKDYFKHHEYLSTYTFYGPKYKEATDLDEMTAIKYRNIQKEAYTRGREEEQKKAEQIIYENYISVQKVKDKIEELKQEKGKYGNCLIEMYEDELVNRNIKILQELLESEE